MVLHIAKGEFLIYDEEEGVQNVKKGKREISVKTKILLLIIVVIVCVGRWHNLKENSESFNKGLERMEEVKEGAEVVVGDIGNGVKNLVSDE